MQTVRKKAVSVKPVMIKRPMPIVATVKLTDHRIVFLCSHCGNRMGLATLPPRRKRVSTAPPVMQSTELPPPIVLPSAEPLSPEVVSLPLPIPESSIPVEHVDESYLNALDSIEHVSWNSNE